jgi:hypothetical protein
MIARGAEMCLWLFNPPEPSCAPVDKRALGSHGQSECGMCACVPPFWKVIGTPGDAYAGLFLNTILARDVPTFETDLFEPCQWTRAVNLFPVATEEHFFGSIILRAGPGTLSWTLTLTGLPAVFPVPADVSIYQQNAFDAPDRRPFRCLSPNIFDLDPFLGSGNFTGLPQTITVQPFWP